jgi:hypothetical protein
MRATLIILPVVHRPAFHDPDWREQYERECRARCEELLMPPPRTRLLVVYHRPEGRTER